MKNRIKNSLLRWILLVSMLPISTEVLGRESKSIQPNILFIFTDDQSYRTVSCYEGSHPWVKTPNLDRLAASGVRFKSAYTGSWCMPARATILTGKYPHAIESLRMVGEYPGMEYDPDQVSFWPSEFRKKGYTTAHIGKWHLGPDTGAGRDWDYQASWSRPEKVVGTVDPYYENQLISFDGKPAVEVPGYATDNYTKWAVDFIEEKGGAKEAPWFLWLCYTAPHAPYTPAERHRDDYADARIEVPEDIYSPRPGKPSFMQEINYWVPGKDGSPRYRSENGQRLATGVRAYNQTISAIDESVGKLVETLEATGQLENTLVVFTSDQGIAWGHHGFQSKVAAYDDNIRAPMIISQPGTVLSEHVVADPVSGIDLIPTFFAWANIELPWEVHGHDMTGLLKERKSKRDYPVMISHTGWTYGEDTVTLAKVGRDGHSDLMGVPWYTMLRQGELKYVFNFENGPNEELYDISKDPKELSNLASNPEYASALEACRKRAKDELERTNAPFLDLIDFETENNFSYGVE